MHVLFHLYIPYEARAAGIQQSIRVCYYLAKTGVTTHLHICCWTFKNRKELLSFFGFEDLDNFILYFYRNPFESIKNRRFARSYGNLFHAYRFFKLLITREKNNYDLFLSRGFKFPSLYIYFKSFLKFKIVFEFHEINYLRDIPENKIYKINKTIDFDQYSYRNADGIISISNSLKNLLAKKWGKIPKITVIPSGVIPFRSNILPRKNYLKKIFFIGNYYPLSGIDNALTALSKIQGPSLTIVGGVMGSDKDYQRIKNLIADLGLNERVHIRGFVTPNELPKIYEEAEILVMPYTNNTRAKYFASPLKMFEYMQAGKPIVASDLPTIREVLEDGKNAVLAKAEDSDSLSRAILKVVNDPIFARRIATNAYNDAKQFSMEKKCERMKNFFREVLC